MTEEDDLEDDEDHYQEEDDHDDGVTGEARRYQSPAPEPSSMVGLVCPRSVNCRPLIGRDRSRDLNTGL